jgi:hypothetical protein
VAARHIKLCTLVNNSFEKESKPNALRWVPGCRMTGHRTSAKESLAGPWKPAGVALAKHGVDGLHVERQNAWEMQHVARRELWVGCPSPYREAVLCRRPVLRTCTCSTLENDPRNRWPGSSVPEEPHSAGPWRLHPTGRLPARRRQGWPYCGISGPPYRPASVCTRAWPRRCGAYRSFSGPRRCPAAREVCQRGALRPGRPFSCRAAICFLSQCPARR